MSGHDINGVEDPKQATAQWDPSSSDSQIGGASSQLDKSRLLSDRKQFFP